MRIGLENNFFSITKIDPQGPDSAYLVEAAAAGEGFQVRGVHETVTLPISPSVLAEFADFESLKNSLLELRLSEGGWLRLNRNIRGTIVCHYRLCRWQLGAAFEGEIIVDGEFATALCRELKSLLQAD